MRKINLLNSEKARYFGRTRRQLEDEMLAIEDSIWGGAIAGNATDNAEALCHAVGHDKGMITYLAEIEAKRRGAASPVISNAEGGREIESLKEGVKGLLLRLGRLPSEVFDNFYRRHKNSKEKSSDSEQYEALCLYDY